MALSWTPDRETLLALLEARNRDLADLYRQAIEALARDELMQPRLMVASHCLRELFSDIPRALGLPPTERKDVNRAAKKLSQAWPSDGRWSTAAGIDDDTPQSVSADVYRAAYDVASAAATGNENARKLTTLVATGLLPDIDAAAVKRVHDSIEFFREWTHGRDYSKPNRVLPPIQKVEVELQIIEEALLTRLGNMADRARSMRDIIARANRRTDGGSP